MPFGLGMVGEQLCLSKARSNFEGEVKYLLLQNSCASPWGRPLTDFALLSLFSGAPKGTKVPKMSCFCYGRLGKCTGIVRPQCLLFPAVMVYAISKKFQEEN